MVNAGNANITGKRVKIKAKGRIFEGIAMPSTTDSFVLKLNNGYNVGFFEYELLEVKDVKKMEETQELLKNPELPTVKIISTGGTIASKVDYNTGAVTSQFTAEEIVGDVPEVAEVCNIDATLLYNILSENMKVQHWKKLAREVYSALKDYEGVIITHGTDTMAYTASALAFMISTPKPVVLVGAQRSSDRPSSDAAMNLTCSAVTAISDLGEVVVVMHATTSDDYCYVHRGVKVRKCHTSRRDAFRSINFTPLGKIDYSTRQIEWFVKDRFKRGERELELRDKMEENCILIKFFPGLKPDILDYYYDRGYRGFVIEGTGLGHVSTDWIDTLRRICEDCVVVMTSQCLWGRVCDRVYDTGRYLLKAGVIEGEDMLPEVALVKLMWLLGNYDIEDAKKLVKENLVGEITKSTRYWEFEFE
ncbi:MAG: Glu-tRNA(Gln) amidotransferase GatDE subunit D [Archaeoglobus sp.]|nr:MAG: Glu-tRNA(Gln) amidotransferase GatDE subunit D [Archaeoglobus sp.]